MPYAGSERVGKSEATGDRLEEAKHINKSLSALGNAVTQAQNMLLIPCIHSLHLLCECTR